MWVSSLLQQTGIHCRNPPHTTFIIIPQIHAFFKLPFPHFCKNRAKTDSFFKHLTQKTAEKGGFFHQKTPGCVYIEIPTCRTENARHRVIHSKTRTLRIFKGFDVRQNPHKTAQPAGPFLPASRATLQFHLYLQYDLLTYPDGDTGNTCGPSPVHQWRNRKAKSPFAPGCERHNLRIYCGR